MCVCVCVYTIHYIVDAVVDGDDDDSGGSDKICVALNVLNSLSTTNDEKMCKSLT